MTIQFPTISDNEFHIVPERIINALGGEERLSGDLDPVQGPQTLEKRLHHLSERVVETLKEAMDIAGETLKENHRKVDESTFILMASYEAIRIISNSLSSQSLDYPNMGHSELVDLDDKMFLIKYFAHEIQLNYLPANEMYMKLLDREYGTKDHVEFLNKCLGDSA